MGTIPLVAVFSASNFYGAAAGAAGLTVAGWLKFGRAKAVAPSLPPGVMPLLREIDRIGSGFDGDPIIGTPAFRAADELGFIDFGGGFNTDFRLSTRGRKALAADLQKGRP